MRDGSVVTIIGGVGFIGGSGGGIDMAASVYVYVSLLGKKMGKFGKMSRVLPVAAPTVRTRWQAHLFACTVRNSLISLYSFQRILDDPFMSQNNLIVTSDRFTLTRRSYIVTYQGRVGCVNSIFLICYKPISIQVCHQRNFVTILQIIPLIFLQLYLLLLIVTGGGVEICWIFMHRFNGQLSVIE